MRHLTSTEEMFSLKQAQAGEDWGERKKHSHRIKTAEFVMNQSLSLINQQIRRLAVFSQRLHARRINKCIAMESRCLAMRRDCANRQIKSVLPELIKDQFRRAPQRLSREFFLPGGHRSFESKRYWLGRKRSSCWYWRLFAFISKAAWQRNLIKMVFPFFFFFWTFNAYLQMHKHPRVEAVQAR